MALIKCEECGKEISDKAKQCMNCGYVRKVKIICNDCNYENEQGSKVCKNCGAPLKSHTIPNFSSLSKKLNFNKKVIAAIIVIVIIIAGVGIGVGVHNKKLNDIRMLEEEQKRQEQEEYNARPIKVDISMTSYYGTIEYILYELELDFDLVTMGGNCYTGVQKNEFKTEKYGVLHTEYRYCKSNSTLVFRVYNDEKDQPLRDPKSGELPTFDKYGYKTNSKNDVNSL